MYILPVVGSDVVGSGVVAGVAVSKKCTEFSIFPYLRYDYAFLDV